MRSAFVLSPLLAAALATSPLSAQPAGAGVLNANGKSLDQWVKEIDDHDPFVREQAIRVVMQFGPNAKKAIPALLRQLGTTNDLSPRTNAIIALGIVTTTDPAQLKDVVEGLNRMLNSNQGIIRYQAAMSLARIGPPSRTAITALVRVVADKESWEIRFAAANALGVAGKDEQNVPDLRALKALIDATDDISKEVRLEALQSLINLGPPTSPADVAQIKTLLERKMKADKDKSVTIWARVALMRMDAAAVNDANLTVIAKLLKNPDLATAIQAARALGVVGPESKGKVSDLMDALQSPEPLLAGEAAWALGRVGKAAEKALPSLKTLQMHKDEGVRQRATEAIRAIETAPK
jgi:HEAT repeat protein